MSAAMRRILAAAVFTAAVVLSFEPVLIGGPALGTHEHHLVHAGLMLLGVIAGLLAYDGAQRPSSVAWLWLTVLPPVAVAILMSPDLYERLDPLPLLHCLYHVALVLLAMLTAYAGQRYTRGVGWMSAIVLEFMAFASAWGYGVVH